MAARTQIGVSEYLRTSFEGPDREYVDGEIVERPAGENKHSKAQWRLGGIFYKLSESQPLHGRTEIRLQVGPARFRIPDLAIYAGEEPVEPVPSSPPLVTIEILSPDDRMTEMLGKLEEYRAWGVPHVWLADPEGRRLYVYDKGLKEVQTFPLPEFNVQISPEEIF